MRLCGAQPRANSSGHERSESVQGAQLGGLEVQGKRAGPSLVQPGTDPFDQFISANTSAIRAEADAVRRLARSENVVPTDALDGDLRQKPVSQSLIGVICTVTPGESPVAGASLGK